jgi:hypothetical protein
MPRQATAIRHPFAPARLVALAALLAFFFQSFAVQTHVHHPAGLAVAGVSHVTNAAPAGPLKSGDPDDPANCRLCQELAHAGTYLTPAPAPLPILISAVSVVTAALPQAVRLALPGFAWQSRAPPIH